MKFPHFLLIAICIVCVAAAVLWQTDPPNIRLPETLRPVPTAISGAVQGVATLGSGKCRAVQVDPSDPQAFLPDKSCTPGVTDPEVTQKNIYDTICKSGYTKTVRPPVSYTNGLKKQQIIEYGYTDRDMRQYEEDHLISLELGGSPDDPKNLWPEPHPSFNEKDEVENYLHKQVCNGTMTLTDAQQKIAGNWYEVYKQIH